MSTNTTGTDTPSTTTTAPTTSASSATSAASVSTSISESLTTSYSTVTLTSSTSTIPIVSTSSSIVIISTTSIPPSTTIVPAPTSTNIPDSTSVIAVTSVITESPSYNAGTTAPAVIYTITSTLPQVTTTPTAPTSSQSPSSTSAAPSALSASGESTSSSGGLTSGAKIAIAVIIPVVVIAAAFIFGLWFWKRRKARNDAKELRKSEMAEYGFNPNNDPSLVPVAAAAYPDEASEAHEDNSGYRGWGTTSTGRKASTTLGSNSRHLNGPAISDSGSQPGGYAQQASPNGQGSDHYSADPLMNDHPESGDGVGALGAVAAAGAVGAGVRTRNSQVDIRRGPSNASSAYSTGRPQSEASSDAPAIPGGTYYQEEVPYNIYNDAQPQHGPYGDGTYGGGNGQPVIRDVQARRNTRIERAPTFPQTQGGIAQNF